MQYRKSVVVFAASIAVSVVAFACGIVGPEGPNVTLDVLKIEAPGGRDDFAEVISQQPLTIRGAIVNAIFCMGVNADLKESSDRLLLRLRGNSDPCGKQGPDGLGYLKYRATVEGLETGEYELTVIHDGRQVNEGPDTVIHNAKVDVQ